MKKWFAVILLLVFVVSVALPAFAADPVLVNSLSLDKETAIVAIGKTVALKVTIDPKNATNKKLEWISSDENIATVKNGTVKGITVGTAVITVKSADNGETKATCTVTVVQPVKKIIFSDKNVSLAVNTSCRLSANIEPADATNQNIVWSSTNEKVAIVNENGVVKGVSKGAAKITAEAQDGSKVKATIGVSVDEYDMVFIDSKPKNATYRYGSGHYTIKGSVKTGCVDINIDQTEMFAMVAGGLGSNKFEVTPVKPGADVITVKAGKTKTVIKVFVTADAFDENEDKINSVADMIKKEDLSLVYGALKTNTTYKTIVESISPATLKVNTSGKEEENTVIYLGNGLLFGGNAFTLYYFDISDGIALEDALLKEIRCKFQTDNNDFDSVKEAIIAKYGDLVSESTSDWGYQADWIIADGITLSLKNYAESFFLLQYFFE